MTHIIVTRNERSAFDRPNNGGRRNNEFFEGWARKGKDMIIMKRMKEINGKNIQKCLQVLSALYVE